MRICRLRYRDRIVAAFYDEHHIIPLAAAATAFEQQTGTSLDLNASSDLLDFLPPAGRCHESATTLWQWLSGQEPGFQSDLAVPADESALLVPIPRPNKLFLLAGNYAKHIEEGGAVAAERAETFPYVFMKPPTTTLTDPDVPIRIPKVSPHHIDWELELAVVIGKQTKGISEADALSSVAGYTIVNDISDRKFRPNAERKTRDKDTFFDWLHGKWHDSFCPCGPCIVAAPAVSDPQALDLQLRLNGELRQDSSTAQQIFPVAAVIEFISSFVTLEPGDIISTGTPAGVGSSTGTFLKAGDLLEASISSIGTLRTPVAVSDQGD